MPPCKFFSCILFCFFIHNAIAQVGRETELYQEISKADSLLFQAGFNNCDFYAISQITDESLKFYHDISGITSGKKEFIEGIKNNICLVNYRPLRKLLPENHLIYPLRKKDEIYGAIQNGTHEFYAREGNKKEYLTSVANFSNLWIKKEGRWILQNVLSYNHREPQEIAMTFQDDDESIYKLLKKNKVPALGMAILKNSRLTQLKTYGNLYADHTAPIDAIFNVASLTKPVVSMLVLKLVEEGKWDLDEPLYNYWTDPDVKQSPYSKILTTRHILTHQSGFPNWRLENKNKRLKFNFEPGEAYQYSGEGYEYLKKALESKFGRSLGSLAESHIFQPLGMSNTKFAWDEFTDENRFARWHDKEGNNTYSGYKHKSESAADNLLTTIGDYGRFAEYVLNRIQSEKKIYREMITRGNGKENKTAIGLGWELLLNLKGDEYALLHTGGDKGVNTLIMLLPKTGEGIILFTNGDNGNNLYFELIERNLSLGKVITKSSQQ